MVKVIAPALPLALGTFAVSAAVGLAGLPRRQRRRVSLVFAAFEMVMPLIGFGIGRVLGAVIGHTANDVAIAVLIAVGVSMLLPDDGGDVSEVRAASQGHGLALLGLGLSISLDELAIGFTIGLLGVPILIIVIFIGAQAFIAAQLGHRFGARLGNTATDRAEKLAGIVLLLLGVALLVE